MAKSSKTTIALLCAWAPLTCFALWAVYRDPAKVISMAVSPDGSRVAVSRHRMHSTDLELWSTDETPRIIRWLPMEGGLHAGFVDNNRLLIQRFSIEELFEPVVVFDVDSWKQLWQFPVSNFPCKVQCGGGRFAIDEGGTTRVFDGASYQETFQTASGNTMRLSPNGKLLAIENMSQWGCVSVDTGADVLTVPVDTRDGCFSVDGQMFVCSLLRGGLSAFELTTESKEAVTSKGLTGSLYTERLIPTDDGIVFVDSGDDYLKIWEGQRSLARTLFPKTFHDVKIVPVANSKVWISQPGGYLSSLDLATGKLKPLQLTLRGYASSLWLLWCVAWFVARVRQRNSRSSAAHLTVGVGSAPTSLLGGPVLDLSLTLVPVVSYFTIMSNTGIWLTGWDMEIALGGAVTLAHVSLLWLVLARESVTSRLVWVVAGLGALIGVTLAHGIGLLDIGGVVVGALAAALTWWFYRWWATWRLVPEGVTEAKLKPKRFRWTIRNLLVVTAASAVLVQVALQVDFKQLMSRDYFDLSNQWKGGLITFLHAVVPIIVCFGPWSYVKRLIVLGLLLTVYWQIWDSEWERHLAIHLGLMSLAVCCILWLHGYRILRARQPAVN